MAMKSDNNSNNIHVFRVSRVANKSKDSFSNSTTPPTIKSRTSISAETKRLICEDHIENPKFTQEAIAKKYGCKRTTIAKIIKSKDRWLSIESDTAISKRFRQRSSRYPIVENAVMQWLEKEYDNDISGVSDHMLRHQAKQYAQEYHSEGLEEFKASSSWVLNFKRRYINEKECHKSTSSLSPATTTSTDAPMQDVEPLTIQFDTPVTPTTPPTSNNHRSNDEVIKIPSLLDNNTRQASSFNLSQTAMEEDSSTTDEYVSMDEDMRSEGPDYCDDMQSPNFDNMESPKSTTNNDTAPVTGDGDSTNSSIGPQQQPQRKKITKLQAKKHLEAALEFFTSQKSNQPMSADMIKLILQNDF